MGMVIFALVVSAILLLVVYGVAYSRSGAGGVVFVAVGATMLSVFLISAALALQSVLTIFVALVCLAFGFGPKVLVRGALLAMILSLAVVSAWRHNATEDLANLRAEYPLVSLADRLSYESSHANATASKTNESIVLAAEVESRLADLENEGQFWSGRAYMLQSLHTRTADDFVLAQGFGPVRMLGVSRQRIELPDIAPVPLPTDGNYYPEFDSSSESAPCHHQPVAPQGEWANQRPSPDAMLGMHRRGTLDLFNPDRLGYVRDRDHVAGFEPHQFSRVPRLNTLDKGFAPWYVLRLELIGLLRHATAVAYVTKDLPRMNELKEAATRPLETFEVQALAQLRRDEDVVIDDGAERIRMVGSLRAARNCLECHVAERGELLGALSYELVRAGKPQPKQQTPTLEPQALAPTIRVIAAR